jgi:predicted ATPase
MICNEEVESAESICATRFMRWFSPPGKSTIMEALACAIGPVTVGSESVKTDQSLASVRKLSQYFFLSWLKRESTLGVLA